MRTLVVTPQCPAPPVKGTTLRNYHLINALADRCEVLVFSMLDRGDDPAAMAALTAKGVRFVTVPAPERTTSARLRDLLLSNQPDLALRLRSPEAHRRFVETLREFRPDIVQFEAVEAAGAVGPIGQAFRAAGVRPHIVYDAHNVETDLQSTIWKTDVRRPRAFAKAAYSFVQSRRLRRYETRLCAASFRVIAVSEEDRTSLRYLGAKNVSVLPNGVDTEHYRPGRKTGEERSPSPFVVFVGTLDFRPNVDAVVWFADNVMPLLRRENSGVRFAIVGRSPSPAVLSLAAEDIEVVGPVVDERPWLARAAAYVVPLRSGGGMRFKVVQAMASGLPVVSTRFGAAGVAVTSEHIVFAESAREFRDGIQHIIRNPAEARRRADAARRLAVDVYDWKHIVPFLDPIFGPAGNRTAV